MEIIKIGNQFWAIENLNVNCFNNGDEIFHATTNLEWKKASENKTPAWCYYENKIENSHEYGVLYNWYALNDPRGITPQGFRIPTENDFNQLISFVGDDSGQKLKSKNGWLEYGKGNGLDEFGFNAKPGGANHLNYANNPRGPELLYGKDINENAWFWTLTEFPDDDTKLWAFAYSLTCWTSKISKFTCAKSMGFSIRCIKC